MWSLGPSWHVARRALCSDRKVLTAITAGAPHSSCLLSCSVNSSPRASCAAISTAAEGPSSGTGTSRAYPTEPRVGVGVVVFRKQPVLGQDPEILLVRRGKEPDKGRWCFPGGSLELGETLAECAAREVEEEAGLQLLGAAHDAPAPAPVASGESSLGAAGGWSLLRRGPTPYAAVDVLIRDEDEDGRIRFHYAVIEVAAVSSDPDAVPAPGDDADGAQWVPVSRLRGMADLTVRCDEMAEEAVRRFSVAPS